MLVQVLRMYFWLLFASQEAKVSLKRLRTMLFGEKPKKRTAPPCDKSSDSEDGDGGTGGGGSGGRWVEGRRRQCSGGCGAES